MSERRCAVHGGYEMFHTCGGSLGYCSAWSGDYTPGLTMDGGGAPTCLWAATDEEAT